MANYQDLHRYYLQCFVSQRMIAERNARQLYKNACTKYEVEYEADNFQPLLDLINKKLKPLHMEIRHGKSEDDGKAYYALVNCSEDEHSKMATEFTANEIAFFKKVLEMIVMSDDGYLPSMTLINIGTELEVKMTASFVENLLERLVEEKWLTDIDGEFSLGPRTLIELSMYLKNIYKEEIPDCKMCMHIVVKGQSCGNCGIRIHLYCASRFFKGRAPEARKCPGCSAVWLHDIPHIVERIEDTERRDTSTAVQSSSEGGSSEERPTTSRGSRSRSKKSSR